MSQFIDHVTVHATAGNGGHGETSVRREKFKPLGGPDGGNGGHGGDVILVADPQVTPLLDYHHKPHRKATNGEPGKGDLRHGKNGETLYLPVPGEPCWKTSTATSCTTWSPRTRKSSSPTVGPGERATPHWPRQNARPQVLRCWGSPGKNAASNSN